MPLSRFAGKPVLVVNTASACGFTKQYADLESLWSAYKDQGLIVIGAPSNDFGAQEPGTNADINEFCKDQYNVTFPLTAKVTVKGDQAHPFYAWAKEQAGLLASPKWNFHKYLIGPDGTLIDWFATPTNPNAAKVKKAIERILKDQ